MRPYFYQFDTQAHALIRRACDRLLVTSDAQHLNEDSFRSELHAELLPLAKNITTPSNASGEGDLFLRNLRCTIEVKFGNAASFKPLALPGAEQRLPILEEILGDIARLHDDVNFVVLGAQLRSNFSEADAAEHYCYAEDCLRIPNLTNASDPKAWFDSKTTGLAPLSQAPPNTWFGPGIYLPACDVDAKTFRVQGGQGMFLKWRPDYRLDRAALLRIGENRFLFQDLFGAAELGRFIFLFTAIQPDRVKIEDDDVVESKVAYYGTTATSPTDSFTVARRCPARLVGARKHEKLPCYDLRQAVARRNPS